MQTLVRHFQQFLQSGLLQRLQGLSLTRYHCRLRPGTPAGVVDVETVWTYLQVQ